MDGVIRQGVCFFIHDGKGKYAVHKRSQTCRDEQGRWDFGGGGVKFGEKVEDALRREVHEEYRATIVKIEFLGYRDVFRGPEASAPHWITFDFKVEVDPATVVKGEPHKMDDLRWVTVDELFKLGEVHSQIPMTVEKNRAFLE